MTAVYEQTDCTFLYPENWEIDDEETLHWPRTVTVRSPSGAFWSLHIYTWSTRPRELLEEAVKSFQGEYDEVESEMTTTKVGSIEMSGYELGFYCLDFVVRATLRTFGNQHRSYLIISQAEDREFDELDPVFQAITQSMVQNLPDKA